MIPSTTIEEIKNKAEIVGIVSEYVQLKKRGKTQTEILDLRGIKKADLSMFENSHRRISYDPETGLPDNFFAPNDIPRD